MDSKRKVNGSGVAAGDDLDERASKRRKGDNIDVSQEETPESTTIQGLKLVDVLRKTEDKSGRQIATSFLTLPSKRQFPDYYKVIRMPIAIDTIQDKLNKRMFKNLTELESYFKRMIANAKEYNQKGSEVYDDAERLRKALSNFMTKTNPAYKLIPGYTAIPTPLPSDANAPAGAVAREEDADDGDQDDAAETTAAAKRARSRPSRPSKSTPQKKSTTPAVSEGRHAGTGFQGLTFQQAQERILEVLMKEKDHPDDEYATFEVFIDLPDPRLKDYYQVIQHPVSLKSVAGCVKGPSRVVDGTTPSEFKSWPAFEKEMKYIWNNAWQYNEDGSEISLLAKKLQTHFNKLFREAKQAVPEPSAPKIKLKMPEPAPKITLKFGSRASPGSPAPPTNGANGTPANGSRRNPFGGTSSSATPAPNLVQLDRSRSMSGGVPSPTPSKVAVVKNEEAGRNSPAILPAAKHSTPRAASQAVSTPGVTGGGMPPPSTPGIPPSNNLYASSSGYAQSFQHQAQPPAQPSVFDSKFRQPGKNASDAMITNLSLATHPGLNITRHVLIDLPPSDTMTQQSITVSLPHTHYFLQIKPTIASSLFERQYKLFVTCGAQRLHALPAIPGHAVDQRHPLFEARLNSGVNRIEVELIASLPKGAPKQPPGQDVELEKITIFANLLKDPHHR